jgi:uncharacterized phiE125 gp8 family phage protein
VPASLLTVTTPATVTNLTDLASVQSELGLGGQQDATYLGTQIAAASAAIGSWCGRVFARETVRQVWRPEREIECLMLARVPVASITSVVEDGITLDAAAYELDPEGGFLWRLSSDERIAWRARKITITYAAGYLLPGQNGRNLPTDIERACILLVAAHYNGRGRDERLRSDGAQGIGQVSYFEPSTGKPRLASADAEALLQPHQAIRL